MYPWSFTITSNVRVSRKWLIKKCEAYVARANESYRATQARLIAEWRKEKAGSIWFRQPFRRLLGFPDPVKATDEELLEWASYSARRADFWPWVTNAEVDVGQLLCRAKRSKSKHIYVPTYLYNEL